MIITKLFGTSLVMIILGVIATGILSDGFLTWEDVFNYEEDAYWFDKMLKVFMYIGIAGLALLIACVLLSIWA